MTKPKTNLEQELAQTLLYLALDTNALMFGEGNADGKCVHKSMREAIMLLDRTGQDVSGLKVADYED